MATKKTKETPKELSGQDKLNKNFRHSLYQCESLSSADYDLADLLKKYVDKKFDLLIEDLRNKKL